MYEGKKFLGFWTQKFFHHSFFREKLILTRVIIFLNYKKLGSIFFSIDFFKSDSHLIENEKILQRFHPTNRPV